MGRLVEGALYRPEKYRASLAREAEDAQLRGDTNKVHYLAETFGIGAPDYSKIAENFRRIDPYGLKSEMLVRIIRAQAEGDSDEETRIQALYDEYCEFAPEEIPEENSPYTRNLVSRIRTGKSIFDRS